MSEEIYVNRDFGRVTLLGDPSSRTGHLYENTYKAVKASFFSLSRSDQQSAAALMIAKRYESGEMSTPDEQEKALVKRAGESGLEINNRTHQIVVNDLKANNFDSNHEPRYARAKKTKIGNIPVFPT